MTANEKSVLDFLKMMEERKSSDELDQFYHPEVQQIEYPNAVTKNTAFRNLRDLKEDSDKGRKIMTKEEYEVIQLYSFGDTVILEAIWRATLAIPIGSIAAGGQIVAHFAQFFEFKDGKIFRQRNYDCFEPFI